MGTLRRAGVALCVAMALMTASRAGRASPTARLVYVRGEGADSCPDESTLKQAVMAHLGYDPFRPFATTALFAEVRRERDRFVGRVKIVDEAGVERGSRTLEDRGSDCADLAAAVALSMSIAIDPRSALKAQGAPAPEATETASETVEEAPAPAPMPSPPAERPRPGSPPPPSRSSLRLGVGMGAYGSLGEGVSPSVGARGSAELIAPTWSAGLEARGALPSRSSLARGASVETTLVGGAVVPCLRRSLGGVILAACGVGFLGRMEARTVDTARPGNQSFVCVSAGVRVGADIPFSESLTVRIALDALGNISPFVLVADGRRVYESPVVSGLGSGSLVYAF